MDSSRTGTQSIERSVRLLRALATRPRFGWALSDLARQCDLDKGTARRILNCLVRERLVDRSLNEQRYLIGPLAFELGLALSKHDVFKSASIPIIRTLAELTHTVTFLCIRSGDDIVCAARVGEVPESAFTLNVGSRRPMINSAAGAALLVSMSAEERREIFTRNCLALPQSRSSQGGLDKLLRESERTGMGFNEGCFAPSWSSYAIAITMSNEAWASVMLSAPSDWFSESRRQESLAALRRTASELQVTSNAIFGTESSVFSCNIDQETILPDAQLSSATFSALSV
jgi:DNA-binding IclR family transcriptional regulator